MFNTFKQLLKPQVRWFYPKLRNILYDTLHSLVFEINMWFQKDHHLRKRLSSGLSHRILHYLSFTLSQYDNHKNEALNGTISMQSLPQLSSKCQSITSHVL